MRTIYINKRKEKICRIEDKIVFVFLDLQKERRGWIACACQTYTRTGI